MASDLDNRVRARLAEVMRSQGLSEQSVMAETLMMLPAQFVEAYERVYLAAWPSLSGAIRIGDENAEQPKGLPWRTSTSQAETRTGGAKAPGGVGVSKGLRPGDTATKDWVDRKLRKLARDVVARLQGDPEPVRRCTGVSCRKIAETTWNYCPSCGAPTMEVD